MNLSEPQLHVVVIVLGDLGRSPRMQYHALSLLQSGHIVSLIGYTGEDLIPDLISYVSNGESGDMNQLMSDDSLNKSEQQPDFPPQGTLHVVRFEVPAPSFLQRVRVVYFLWRIISLALWLMWVLTFRIPYNLKAPHFVLVQNPPALPLLIVARVYCWLIGFFLCRKRKGPGLIVDWHNLGYSMLTSGALRKVAKAYEKLTAPWADAHLTVTNAMKSFLESEMKLPPEKVQVLPDCPPHMFQPRSLAEQHAILQKLHPQLEKACPKSWRKEGDQSNQTLFTVYRDGKYSPRLARPALITSSTSWTSDEDFGILLAALLSLDSKIEREGVNLRVMVVVTGKGPEKAQYEIQISKLTLHHVAVTTMWLEPKDYPIFLACADVGVSLHTSTSGLDLPMKVLDLFGCQVPVCAMDFDCLSELVQDDVNGHVFQNSDELADQLFELLEPLQHDQRVPCHSFGKLHQYSEHLQNRLRWHDNWCLHARPILEKVANAADHRLYQIEATDAAKS
ncbi:hypothetical protein ACA910_010821 [Epithemia clementina (nom. ined.)]